MKEPAFVALGDCHLEGLIWRRYRQITGDAFAAFRAFCSAAIEWHVPGLLVGDIWDSVEPEPYFVEFFRHEMERCKEEGVRIYAIQGNHDKRPTPWYVAAHDWPIHIGDGRMVEINGIQCVGFDFAIRDQIEEQLMGLSQARRLPQVLFLHQAVKQALGFEGRWNCDLEWVPEGIPLTIMGDIHAPWEERFREGQTAYYTGASHPRSLSELGPKSYLMVYADLSVERYPLQSRQIGRFRVTAADQLREVRTWLEQAEVVSFEGYDLAPVAWVHFTPEFAEDIPRLRADFETAIIVPDPISSPTELDFEFGEEEGEEEELISQEALLAQLISPDSEPEAFAFVTDLLSEGQSVLDVIRAKREHFYQAE